MRRSIFFSHGYSPAVLSAVLLLLRLAFGTAMATHGYSKLQNYDSIKGEFMDFMGMGMEFSLILVIFAELVCSVLLIVGLFTRIATIPLIIATLVMIFSAHAGDIFGEAYPAFSFLIVYVVLFAVGPGKFSADNLLNKERRG
jgi:putative oxidoreductase